MATKLKTTGRLSRGQSRRGVPAPARGTTRNAPPPPPDPTLPWHADEDVKRATESIRTLTQQDTRDSVDRAHRMGGLLRHIADRLAHGQWMRWVAEAVPGIEHRTINRYIGLSVFAELYPDEFKNLRTLSLPKLYALAGTTPKIRKSLYGRAVAIPGTDLRLTLALMSAAQLARVLAKFRGADREVPSAVIIRSSV